MKKKIFEAFTRIETKILYPDTGITIGSQIILSSPAINLHSGTFDLMNSYNKFNSITNRPQTKK